MRLASSFPDDRLGRREAKQKRGKVTTSIKEWIASIDEELASIKDMITLIKEQRALWERQQTMTDIDAELDDLAFGGEPRSNSDNEDEHMDDVSDTASPAEKSDHPQVQDTNQSEPAAMEEDGKASASSTQPKPDAAMGDADPKAPEGDQQTNGSPQDTQAPAEASTNDDPEEAARRQAADELKKKADAKAERAKMTKDKKRARIEELTEALGNIKFDYLLGGSLPATFDAKKTCDVVEEIHCFLILDGSYETFDVTELAQKSGNWYQYQEASDWVKDNFRPTGTLQAPHDGDSFRQLFQAIDMMAMSFPRVKRKGEAFADMGLLNQAKEKVKKGEKIDVDKTVGALQELDSFAKTDNPMGVFNKAMKSRLLGLLRQIRSSLPADDDNNGDEMESDEEEGEIVLKMSDVDDAIQTLIDTLETPEQ